MSDAEVEPEFVQLFVEDALVKLNKMGEQLLELEGAADTSALLATLSRDAHSLKGAAGMVGLNRFAAVAHAFEDPLQGLRNGSVKVTPALVDRLLAAVDGLRALAQQSTSDDTGSADLANNIVAQLSEGPGGGPVSATATPTGLAASQKREPADDGDRVRAGATIAEPAKEHPPEPTPALNAGTAGTTTMQIAVQRLDQIDRLVSESAAAHLRVGLMLAEDYKADPESMPEYRDLARLLGRLQEVTMRARMVPLATITPSLHRAVRDIAHMTGKKVRWEVAGEDTEIDRKVLELLLDPLIHLVRNSVDHGLETPAERLAVGKPEEGVVRVRGRQHGSEIVLSVSDDGRGIDVDKLRTAAQRAGIDTSTMSEAEVRGLIFKSRLSTAAKVTEISGRGVGLDVVRANLELVRGRVDLDSQPGKGAEFKITVPITLTIVECLVVESAGQSFAIPMQSVVYLLPPGTKDEHVGGRPMIIHGETAVPVFGLADTLDLGGRDGGPLVVIRNDQTNLAFRVGRLVGHRDMVIKGLGTLLPRNDVVAGAAMEPDGAVVIVLDVDGIGARARRNEAPTRGAEIPPPTHRPSILVVDDALTVRELQRSILERAGYSVRVAANGREAMTLLMREPSDLVLTDVEMPAMDGFELTQSIRTHAAMSHTPVVILTSHDSETDRQKGMSAGADAYIIKSGFDQQSLLSLVEKLLLGGRA